MCWEGQAWDREFFLTKNPNPNLNKKILPGGGGGGGVVVD